MPFFESQKIKKESRKKDARKRPPIPSPLQCALGLCVLLGANDGRALFVSYPNKDWRGMVSVIYVLNERLVSIVGVILREGLAGNSRCHTQRRIGGA